MANIPVGQGGEGHAQERLNQKFKVSITPLDPKNTSPLTADIQHKFKMVSLGFFCPHFYG